MTQSFRERWRQMSQRERTLVLAGGIGAGMRLVTRRGREGRTKGRFGRFSVGDRD